MNNTLRTAIFLSFWFIPSLLFSYECSYATEINCGDSKWYDAPTANHFESTHYDVSDCGNSSWAYTGNERLFHLDVGTNAQDVTIKLTGLSGDLDLMVFKTCSSGGGSAFLKDCIDVSDNSGNKDEEATILNATGEYYIMVDGYSTAVKSGFDIAVSCVPKSTTISCSSAKEITCGNSYWLDPSTTNTFNKSSYDFSDCGFSNYDYEGNDYVFVLDVGTTYQDVNIVVNGLSADLDVLVFKACSGTQFGTCAGFGINNGSDAESVHLTKASGIYYVVVDGFLPGASSGFDLRVYCTKSYTPSSDCQSATTLSCGDNKWINAATTDNFSGSDYNFSSCFNNSYEYAGRDHLYKISLGSSTRNIRIDVTNLSSDLDLFLFKSCSDRYGGDVLGSCLAYSFNTGTKSESITLTGATGTYYLSVDGFSPGASSGYEISMYCDTYRPTYGCSEAIPLTCGSSYWTAAATSNDLEDWDYNMTGCLNSSVNYPGNDRLYVINAGSSPTDLSIDMTGLSADLDMFLFETCYNRTTGAGLGNCVAYSRNSGRASERIYVPDAIGTYYLAVDATSATARSGYDLELRCTDRNVPNRPCTVATEIGCGDKIIASNSINDPSSTDRMNSHFGCNVNGAGYSSREVVFKLDGGYYDLNNVSINLKSLTQGVNYDLFIYRDCTASFDAYNNDWNYGMDIMLTCGQQLAGYGESVYLGDVDPYDDIYIVVDVKSSSNKTGLFELSVECDNFCSHPTEAISCDSRISSNTIGGRDVINDYACDNRDNSGPEHVYELVIEETTEVRIDLLVGAEADLNMFLLPSCSFTACLSMSSNEGTGVDEQITRRVNPGTYYLVVDGTDNDAGSYELVVSGCSCFGAQPISCGVPISSTTAGASNDLDYINGGCKAIAGIPTELPGKDKFFNFIAPYAGTYTIELSGLYKDLDLFVMSDCEATNSCIESSNRIENNTESLTLSLSAYEEISIIVDTRWAYVTSDFTLTVTCTDSEEPGEEEEEEEPEEEEPESSPCFAITQFVDQSFEIDLTSSLGDTSCEMHVLAVYDYDLVANEEIQNSRLEISIDSFGIGMFAPATDEESHTYLICHEYVCNELMEMCCETVTVAPVLYCGSVYSGTTIGAENQFSQDDISACYVSNSSFNGPDQLIQFIKEDSSDIIQLILEQKTANLSLFIFDENLSPIDFTCKGSNFNNTKMVSNTASIGEVYTDADQLLPAGRYYALIEGFAAWIASDYTLTVSCGLACDGPMMIGCGMDLDNESNSGLPSMQAIYKLNEDSLAVGYTGGEELYQLNVSAEQTLTITVDNISDSADFDLFVLGHDCGTGVVRNYSINQGDLTERITSHFTPGYYRVVVDGWLGSEGTYDLSVSGCDDIGAVAAPLATARSIERINTGLSELEVSAYPNPFSDQLTINILSKSDLDGEIRLFDVSGKMLQNQGVHIKKGKNTIRILASQLDQHQGLTFYTINTAEAVHHGKVLRVN